MLEINKNDQLINILSKNKFVLVDFYASWCSPCQQITPCIKKCEDDFSNKIIFCGVDVDEDSDILEKYNIVTIPVLLLFIDGKLVERIQGSDCLEIYNKLKIEISKI